MKYQSKCPSFMIESKFKKEFKIEEKKIVSSWIRLQKRETFTKSQIPPFRVEFDNCSQYGEFKEGELNIHHGPFLHLPARVGVVKNDYRDLNYLYGAYVFSFRLIRPVKLEFFKKNKSIELNLLCYIHPRLKKIWPSINKFFWIFFKI